MNSPKRVLLTGVGGSIGCHTLIHLLHNTGWDVIGVDSFRHKGLRDRVTTMLGYHPEYLGRVEIFQHDLINSVPGEMAARFGPVDYIIAMASLSDVHDSLINPVPFLKNNLNIVLSTLEYARLVKPTAFLLVSTDEVYGPTDGKTLHCEWDPIIPSNPYSASKCAQEAVAISYWRSYSTPLIIVNLMNNFGEMQSPAKFPAIIQRKVRAGEEIEIHSHGDRIGSRVYIHSRNSSDAILFLLNKVEPHLHQNGDVDRPDRYNIVGDRQIDNLELAQMIAAFIGKPLRYRLVPAAASRPGHDIHYGLDGEKLAALGWKQPIPFEESMRHVVEWYEQNPDWLDKTQEYLG